MATFFGLQIPTDTGRLPSRGKIGNYHLAFMQQIHPLLPQVVSGVSSGGVRDFSTATPQLITFNLVGPYENQHYTLQNIKYFSNAENDYVSLTTDDKYLNLILQHISELFSSQILLLEGEPLRGQEYYMHQLTGVEEYNFNTVTE
ncbi:hypothetical protein [Acinetobacter modestus]|uniref:hypothetical protein n=1 Tax=Acinetobacter modestus TaxID=1776740 RepID=UPI001F4B9553|nr:hypothetical protein [Acinetobacter modestus]MCH7332145.1 hypothetical protein [Acinetobacter modestus]